jgi:hypothetical protein
LKVAVLVPWRAGDPWRERAWRYVEQRWCAMGWPVVTGGTTQVGTFNRAAARNEAARAVDWDVGIFADADVFVRDREQVEPAVVLAAATDRLTLPFEDYTPLTEAETGALLAGVLPELPSRHPEPDPSVGGGVIVTRDLWERLGGFDEAFVGWGFEDSAFYTAAGGGLRTPGELWHLWHPPAPETNPRHPLHQANRARAVMAGWGG